MYRTLLIVQTYQKDQKQQRFYFDKFLCWIEVQICEYLSLVSYKVIFFIYSKTELCQALIFNLWLMSHWR